MELTSLTNYDTIKTIKIGYFPLRGRAQVPRLILQYLKVPYQDQLFHSVKEWMDYKNEHQKSWPFLSLPYLIDGNVKITQTVPIVNYIVNKYSPVNLLGKNLRDEAILNMYTSSIDNIGVSLVALCWMQGEPDFIEEQKQKFWQQNLQDKMDALQMYLADKPWMFGYLSLFDFSIYELVHYVDIVFPRRIKEFQRLLRIQMKIRDLPEIKRYQTSNRAIKVFLPPNPMKNAKK